ncbi:hypothetical protein [endosymbiont of Ridgeia piscesae]|jgi:hypothetical protein|uniref:Uncharacterized protein n=1 Tax=endosymbiont of Ridgeia piscesae TaxID=54398 RepID=A0A0T5YX99_9GAMM|nr:hypothetical protein [endosymbiont of Ridgeia piscesae]KRT55268.1 hypothetical protein Ga0074115_11626 [endosymbiont of Ridgeia piscesae]KRT59018.1 hypothetical protein Ga0076813_14643 [endosymbiont of Ridgeia piscesae]
MTIFTNRVVLSLGCALILQAAAISAAEMSEQMSHSGTRMMDDKGMMEHKQMQSEGMQGKMGETPMQAQGMHDSDGRQIDVGYAGAEDDVGEPHGNVREEGRNVAGAARNTPSGWRGRRLATAMITSENRNRAQTRCVAES